MSEKIVNIKQVDNGAKVLIIYTGGTIGMRKNIETGLLQPDPQADTLKRLISEAVLCLTIDFISQAEVKDSANISIDDWKSLAEVIIENYSVYDGFVVLHGTDTMAYTASALSFMLQGTQKPIVFTGSQLSVYEESTDAKLNLIGALNLLDYSINNSLPFREVALFFNGKLLRANRSTKKSTDNFDAFHSPNYPILGEVGDSVSIDIDLLWSSKQESFNLNLLPQVGLLMVFPGISNDVLKTIFNYEIHKIVILEGYGSGNVPMDTFLHETILSFIAKGGQVFLRSQCLEGEVTINRYETGNQLAQIGVIGLGSMTRESAMTKAMSLLAKQKISDMVICLTGEI